MTKNDINSKDLGFHLRTEQDCADIAYGKKCRVLFAQNNNINLAKILFANHSS